MVLRVSFDKQLALRHIHFSLEFIFLIIELTVISPDRF